MEDALGRAARASRAAAVAEHGTQKTAELKRSFERNSPGKCVRTGAGALLKSRAVFLLMLIVGGGSRKC